jgi:hypothetical protein
MPRGIGLAPALIGMATIAERSVAAAHGQALISNKSGALRCIVSALMLILICNI